MHFCKVCENMYYLKLDEEDPNKLVYYCRNCNDTNSDLTDEDVIVCEISTKQSQLDFSHYINQYTKLDPTLPRINNVLCPNPDCNTNTNDEPREIIYIRYNELQMKYVYLCSTCDAVWKTEDKN